MIWSPEQQTAARSEAWELVDTVEGNRLVLRIYGVMQPNMAANAHVLRRAREGSRLHVEALRAIVKSSSVLKGK